MLLGDQGTCLWTTCPGCCLLIQHLNHCTTMPHCAPRYHKLFTTNTVITAVVFLCTTHKSTKSTQFTHVISEQDNSCPSIQLPVKLHWFHDLRITTAPICWEQWNSHNDKCTATRRWNTKPVNIPNIHNNSQQAGTFILRTPLRWKLAT